MLTSSLLYFGRRPESSKNATADVLDGPEVEREKEDDEDETSDETVGEPTAQKVNWMKVGHISRCECEIFVYTAVKLDFVDF